MAANLLDQVFQASRPSQIWLGVITYIPTDEGWLYLTGYKNLFSGEIVGYAMSTRMTKGLVIQALFRAVSAKRPEKGLILHSDRGSQYCSHAFASRKGNCNDNAPMAESEFREYIEIFDD